MDATGVARQFTCDEESDDGNWIDVIEKKGSHLRHDLLPHLVNVAQHRLVVTSKAASEAIGTISQTLCYSAVLCFGDLVALILSLWLAVGEVHQGMRYLRGRG